MEVEECHQILVDHAVPFPRSLIGDKFIIQHDNNPKHTANALDRKTHNDNFVCANFTVCIVVYVIWFICFID